MTRTLNEMDNMTREDQSTNEETRKLLWQFDTKVLPILAVLFMCCHLNRTNVGNARLYGLEKDIQMTDRQYDQALAVLYATFIASALPSNIYLKSAGPRVWISLSAVAWGIVSMCLGFVQNFSQFVVVRALLGAAQGGYLPGVVVYLSGMYMRRELTLRLGLYYSACTLSGAFGGLAARAIALIDRTNVFLAPWRWIFVIEGLLSVVLGAVAYMLLPNTIGEARFLSKSQQQLARSRLESDSDRLKEMDEKFSWSEVRRGIVNPHFWLTALADFGIVTSIYPLSLFLPTIVEALGYTADEAQLLSAIPFGVAFVTTILTAFISDYVGRRGVVLLCPLSLAIAGYGVIANSTNPKVKYGVTFLMTAGLFSSVPPILGWLANNSAGHYKRATTSAMLLVISNCGGFLAVFLYPKSQEPQFFEGHTIMLTLLITSWILTLCNIIYCWKINRDKERGLYDKFSGCGDDRDPLFKYIL